MLKGRNTCYAYFTEAMLSELSHLVDAMQEYQKLPAGCTIDWVSVEVVTEADGIEKVVVVGMLMDGDVPSKIYGMVPTDIVMQKSKQAVFEYFDLQATKRQFEKHMPTKEDVLH